MGDRTIEAHGSCIFEDLTNNIKAVIVFSTLKKSGFWKKTESGRIDHFNGLIYECKPIINHKKTEKLLYGKGAEEIKDLSKLKDIVRPICDISGSWLKNLIIDGKTYWDIDTCVPSR